MMLRATFWLQEEVTPDLFFQKLAMGCARSGVLRIGEGISAWQDGVEGRYMYVRDEMTSMEKLGLGKNSTEFEMPIIEFVSYGSTPC